MAATVRFLDTFYLASAEELQLEIDHYAKEHNGENLVNLQDRDGQTLAHHIAANPGGFLDPGLVSILLKNKPDFSIKDKEGNTPLHIITFICHHRDAAPIFMDFVQYAAKTQFDFSSLNNEGLSVLLIASFTAYHNSLRLGPMSNKSTVAYILAAAKKHDCAINLDVPSTETGATALYHLLDKCRFLEAKMLIEAGASLTGQGDAAVNKSPYSHLLQMLREFKYEYRGNPRCDQRFVIAGVAALEEIKEMMDARLKSSPDTAHLVEDVDKKEEEALQHFINSLQEVSLMMSNNPEPSEEDNSDSDQDEKAASQPLTAQTENPSLPIATLLSASLQTSWGGRASSPDNAAKEKAESANRETPGLKM